MPKNLQDRFQRRILSWHFLQKTAKILDFRTGSEQGLECYLAGFYNYPVAIPIMATPDGNIDILTSQQCSW